MPGRIKNKMPCYLTVEFQPKFRCEIATMTEGNAKLTKGNAKLTEENAQLT
jgi:hypothetical protein